MDYLVVDYQQPRRAVFALQAANVTHGFEGEATLFKVSVRPGSPVQEGIFFCPVQSAILHTEEQAGDGGPLSDEVLLMGFFPTPPEGIYDLTVPVCTTGRIGLSEPRWAPHEAKPMMVDAQLPRHDPDRAAREARLRFEREERRFRERVTG